MESILRHTYTIRMSKTDCLGGRLGNQFFINVAASLLAEKHNLYIIYQGDTVYELFPLFVGSQVHSTTVIVKDDNYIDILNEETIDYNLSFYDYFQSTHVTTLTHKYIYSKMKLLIERNPYKNRYNNNDCFIHVRLGDVAQWNPGVSYYEGILSKLNVNHVYIASDSKDHPIIQSLMKSPNRSFYDGSPIDTVLFGCTNKHIILSHGTFSGMIGYLAFYSTVYFLKESDTTSWDYFGGNGKFNIFEGKHTKMGPFLESM